MAKYQYQSLVQPIFKGYPKCPLCKTEVTMGGFKLSIVLPDTENIYIFTGAYFDAFIVICPKDGIVFMPIG